MPCRILPESGCIFLDPSNMGGLLVTMVTFFLIRHGESEGNVLGVRPGHLPFHLTALGIKQAQLTGQRLAGCRLDAVYASDSVRTRETAHYIMEHQSCPLIFDSRLRDLYQGQYLGLTDEEIRARFPEAQAELERDPICARRPGGETMLELQERSWRSICDMVETWSGKDDAKIGVVTHGGVVNMLAHKVTSKYSPIMAANCSITIMRYNGGNWELKTLNDTSHLDELSGSIEPCPSS